MSSPDHGSVRFSSRTTKYYHGGVATYVCDTGSEHISGNLSRTCTCGGTGVTWSGTAPTCMCN